MMLPEDRPYLIAEIGGNHEGSFEAALALCDLALGSGADAVKFQLYRADHLVNSLIDPERHGHFRGFELSRDQHITLAERCLRAGVDYLASVWDTEMLDWIDSYLHAYKVGSGDLTARPLVREFARRGKPIILSTGLSSLAEVNDAVADIRTINPAYEEPDSLVLLQCTSSYPTEAGEANLRSMATLASITGVEVGYSDHTLGQTALKVAAARGARVLEFHFTDSREDRTFRDHQVSLTSSEVRKLRDWCDTVAATLGAGDKRPTHGELLAGHDVSFRRGLYPARDLPAGHVISSDDIVALRPAVGIGAEHFDAVIGATLAVHVREREPLDQGMLL